MQLLDARRLTGPSLLSDDPATVVDVASDREGTDALYQRWQQAATEMLDTLGRAVPAFRRLDLTGGASFAFDAPIDALYAATAVNEWAFETASARLGGEPARSFDEAAESIRQAFADEANPALLALAAAADARGVPLLWDDDEVSLGHGHASRTWPARELPAPDTIAFESLASVPTGLVTGTNGKTTTVRLAGHILRAAGRVVGQSSTDWIAVDDRVLDRDDWSGPGGARTVLRQPDVETAVLESARGGLLRRGLGVRRASAALITNVSADHLGDFGSRTIGELLNIKWIVSRAVRHDGRLILNADDPLLVDKVAGYPGALAWFSLDARNPVAATHAAAGGLALVADDGQLVLFESGERHVICGVADVPLTMEGAARHNVANALAAAALARCLGAPADALRAGLESMTQSDNPGRCNVYEVAGRHVLVDFAHNPEAMSALRDMASALPARRRFLCFGQAGDRPDELIREMTRTAWNIGLDRVIVSELAKYHRGRQAGEVFAVIRDALLELGASPDAIEHHDTELESFDAAFRRSRPGDLIIMLALAGAGPIRKRIDALRADN